jgi:hypothetical protein
MLHVNKSNIGLNASGISRVLQKQISQRQKRSVPKGNKIEERLIKYGENLKLKQAEKKLEKLKVRLKDKIFI